MIRSSSFVTHRRAGRPRPRSWFSSYRPTHSTSLHITSHHISAPRLSPQFLSIPIPNRSPSIFDAPRRVPSLKSPVLRSGPIRPTHLLIFRLARLSLSLRFHFRSRVGRSLCLLSCSPSPVFSVPVKLVQSLVVQFQYSSCYIFSAMVWGGLSFGWW